MDCSSRIYAETSAAVRAAHPETFPLICWDWCWNLLRDRDGSAGRFSKLSRFALQAVTIPEMYCKKVRVSPVGRKGTIGSTCAYCLKGSSLYRLFLDVVDSNFTGAVF